MDRWMPNGPEDIAIALRLELADSQSVSNRGQLTDGWNHNSNSDWHGTPKRVHFTSWLAFVGPFLPMGMWMSYRSPCLSFDSALASSSSQRDGYLKDKWKIFVGKILKEEEINGEWKRRRSWNVVFCQVYETVKERDRRRIWFHGH